ncbi:hypothetical protein GGS23DRAFT_570265 [Durotheca rogersii]|uniref:uncharacterized protein n=1 Tax=Durotheca rogersii TaxID=419775 RepID=UPI00221F4868|nr:uncharacterized protein GGS23DRAFT_570265 [Durotheca rogersii]KAI5862944.1 hypothetical protein GGS23DRAFT_570265 [Durotheca rogersii]
MRAWRNPFLSVLPWGAILSRAPPGLDGWLNWAHLSIWLGRVHALRNLRRERNITGYNQLPSHPVFRDPNTRARTQHTHTHTLSLSHLTPALAHTRDSPRSREVYRSDGLRMQTYISLRASPSGDCTFAPTGIDAGYYCGGLQIMRRHYRSLADTWVSRSRPGSLVRYRRPSRYFRAQLLSR